MNLSAASTKFSSKNVQTASVLSVHMLTRAWKESAQKTKCARARIFDIGTVMGSIMLENAETLEKQESKKANLIKKRMKIAYHTVYDSDV